MPETKLAAPLAHLRGARPEAPRWFEAALAQEPARARVPVAGADIEVLTWGTRGRPGLLFLHGNGAHADWWRFIAPAFAGTHHVAALSWSGMGGSAWRASYSIALFCEEIVAVAEAAGFFEADDKPTLVAHSFGGAPAVAAAAAIGHRLAGVVLADTPFWTPERLAARKVRAAAREAPQPTKVYASLEAALERFRFLPEQPCGNLFIADFIARTSLHRVSEGWTWRFDPSLWQRFDFGDFQADLRGVRCPLALLWGSRSRLYENGGLDTARRLLPAGTPVVELADAAHHLMVDQPLAFVAALRAFAAKMAATR